MYPSEKQEGKLVMLLLQVEIEIHFKMSLIVFQNSFFKKKKKKCDPLTKISRQKSPWSPLEFEFFSSAYDYLVVFNKAVIIVLWLFIYWINNIYI